MFSAIIIAATLMLGGCHGDDIVKVNMEDPDSPKYPYMAHEFALLQLAVDDIQGMEQKKQYGQIYDKYASPELQKYVSRRQFMIMSNCTEQNLGAINEFDEDNLSFNRNQKPEKGRPAIDSITRQVKRKRGIMREQLVFTSDGVKFKLNGLWWISDNKQFQKCITAAQKASRLPPPPTPPEPLKLEDEDAATTTGKTDTGKKDGDIPTLKGGPTETVPSPQDPTPSGTPAPAPAPAPEPPPAEPANPPQ